MKYILYILDAMKIPGTPPSKAQHVFEMHVKPKWHLHKVSMNPVESRVRTKTQQGVML